MHTASMLLQCPTDGTVRPGSHQPAEEQETVQFSEPLGDPDDAAISDSDCSELRSRDRPRRPHLQGRFSGRLETKGDEKNLVDECRLLGPLLGGLNKLGDRSRLTLAKIVRGIASGEVRRHCLEREQRIKASSQPALRRSAVDVRALVDWHLVAQPDGCSARCPAHGAASHAPALGRPMRALPADSHVRGFAGADPAVEPDPWPAA